MVELTARQESLEPYLIVWTENSDKEINAEKASTTSKESKNEPLKRSSRKKKKTRPKRKEKKTEKSTESKPTKGERKKLSAKEASERLEWLELIAKVMDDYIKAGMIRDFEISADGLTFRDKEYNDYDSCGSQSDLSIIDSTPIESTSRSAIGNFVDYCKDLFITFFDKVRELYDAELGRIWKTYEKQQELLGESLKTIHKLITKYDEKISELEKKSYNEELRGHTLKEIEKLIKIMDVTKKTIPILVEKYGIDESRFDEVEWLVRPLGTNPSGDKIFGKYVPPNKIIIDPEAPAEKIVPHELAHFIGKGEEEAKEIEEEITRRIALTPSLPKSKEKQPKVPVSTEEVEEMPIRSKLDLEKYARRSTLEEESVLVYELLDGNIDTLKELIDSGRKRGFGNHQLMPIMAAYGLKFYRYGHGIPEVVCEEMGTEKRTLENYIVSVGTYAKDNRIRNRILQEMRKEKTEAKPTKLFKRLLELFA